MILFSLLSPLLKWSETASQGLNPVHRAPHWACPVPACGMLWPHATWVLDFTLSLALRSEYRCVVWNACQPWSRVGQGMEEGEQSLAQGPVNGAPLHDQLQWSGSSPEPQEREAASVRQWQHWPHKYTLQEGHAKQESHSRNRFGPQENR